MIYSISNEYGYGPLKLISCKKEKLLTINDLGRGKQFLYGSNYEFSNRVACTYCLLLCMYFNLSFLLRRSWNRKS